MDEQTTIFSAMDTSIPTTQSSGSAPVTPAATPVVRPAAQQQSHPNQQNPKPQVPSTQAPRPAHSFERKSSLDEMHQLLIAGLKTFFEKNNFKKGVIGVSGGVDSALTLQIAVDALGADNITALILPEVGLTKQENIDHARGLCEFLGVTYHFQPINSFVSDFSILPWTASKVALMNNKARIRMVLLYNLANSQNALVLGTSNKSEILLGYGTKHGDLAADIEVIGDLFKTEVVRLADHVGLPPEIVNKVPSAELAPGQTDEQEMGATYKEMDQVLMKLDQGPQTCVAQGMSSPIVDSVFARVIQNKHKRALPPVIKLP